MVFLFNLVYHYFESIYKLMKYLFLVLLASISLNINAQQSSLKTIGVAPNLSFQNYEHFKRLVMESPDYQAEFIEGFQFNSGIQLPFKGSGSQI